MARKEILKNITDVLGFVYDADTLPTAVIDFRKSAGGSNFVISVHALREGDAGLLKLCFDKCSMDYDGEFEAVGLRFYEDYDSPRHVCYGMYLYQNRQDEKRIAEIEEWATKSHEMCA